MKVLFATDGSENARFAQEFLLRYPLAPEDLILCVSVVYQLPTLTPTSLPLIGKMVERQLAEIYQKETEELQEALKNAEQFFRAGGFRVETHLLKGDPAPVIARFAEEQDVNLTVVGARGITALEAMFLGSVARYLANDTALTVLVCRQKPFAETEGLRVIFATDHSPYCEKVSEKLPTLLSGKFHSLLIASVLDTSWRGFNPPIAEEHLLSAKEELNTKNQNLQVRLAPLAEKVASVVLVGEPRAELMALCEKENADLIIVGARGGSGIKRLLLGSVAHQMLTRTKGSVLVVRV
ncbi:MAG: universal stress protein [Fimbriimonadales bacterium]|nr:universal stress protein [Fimbriimonadales bacterium]